MSIKHLAALALLSTVISTGLSAQEHMRNVQGPGGYAITAFDRTDGRNFAGYFDTEFIFDENNNGEETSAFRAHRFVLETSTQIHRRILASAEIEYEYGAVINNRSDDGELKIEQAWVDFEIARPLVFRTGVVVTPFGRENILHDSDARDLTAKSVYAYYIVPGTWSEVGAGFRGDFDAFGDWLINYEVYATNGLADKSDDSLTISESNGLRSARGGFKENNNKNKAIVGRVGVSPMLGLEIGTSFYNGDYDDEGQKNLSIVGLDGLWNFGPFEIIGEYARVKLDETAGLPETMWGYYVEARYHFFPEFLQDTFLTEDFDNPTFTLVGRVSQVDTNTATTSAQDITQYTIGLNYRPMETFVAKVEYEINNEAANQVDDNRIITSVAVGF